MAGISREERLRRAAEEAVRAFGAWWAGDDPADNATMDPLIEAMSRLRAIVRETPSGG